MMRGSMCVDSRSCWSRHGKIVGRGRRELAPGFALEVRGENKLSLSLALPSMVPVQYYEYYFL